MLIDFILLFLFAGVPYYLLFEKTNILAKDKIFLLSAVLVIGGICLAQELQYKAPEVFVVAAFFTSIFTLYKVNQTNNMYKLAYYILFFNAPLFLMFRTKESMLYGVSLLVTLFGVYLMGKYYERSYGSANYQSVSGITLKAPFAGFILTVYFTTLALYPPFPNALLFLNGMLNSELTLMWYLVVIVIFFGNFLIAAHVMAKTVFGKPNPNIHYIDVSTKERILHIMIFIILFSLSVIGLEELL